MEVITKRFKKLMTISIIMSIIDIIIGLIFINCTDFATKINIIILGSLITIHGLFFLIRYLYDGLGNKFFAIDLIVAIASIILGVFIIFNPFNYIALKVIGIFFCIWLCFNGLEKLYYSYRFMCVQESIYPLTLFIGLLMIIMGIITLINPFKGFMLVTKLIGIFLICSGLLDAMVCNLFRQRAKNILHIFE